MQYPLLKYYTFYKEGSKLHQAHRPVKNTRLPLPVRLKSRNISIWEILFFPVLTVINRNFRTNYHTPGTLEHQVLRALRNMCCSFSANENDYITVSICIAI